MPSTSDPVAASENWAAYCLTCHGASGSGIDSPDPLHQHGSRADLTDRATRQLSDGDIYWLITMGIGGTQMPAYDAALTEQERWDLVAYIRQLQDGR
jgi:mono/diheme cytochrome c family protein